MKDHKPQIEIPIPCHENWDAMTPREQGRFCDACEKTVVDFTVMSYDEIIDLLKSKKESVCGRFKNTQIKPQRELPNKMKIFLYALFSIFLLQVTEFSSAQTLADTTQQENQGIIYGRVTDDKKQALEFATVQVFEDGILKGAAKTDLKGNFVIAPLKPGLYTLNCIYVGMNQQEVMDIPVANGDKRRVDISMQKKRPGKKGEMRRMTTVGIISPVRPDEKIQQLDDIKHTPVR